MTFLDAWAGSMKPAERGQAASETRVISCRTFNRNLQLLSRYVALQQEPAAE